MVDANLVNLTDAAIHAQELPWYVVYTKASQERVAETHLLRQGYQVYLPRTKILKKRKLQAETQVAAYEAMFPRYIFFQARDFEHSIAPVRSSVGVSKLVRFGSEPAKLSAETLNKIREAEALQQASSYEDLCGLKPGKKVVVNEGPLLGLDGLISEISKERVMVLMHLLGREAKVSFKLAQLMLAA